MIIFGAKKLGNIDNTVYLAPGGVIEQADTERLGCECDVEYAITKMSVRHCRPTSDNVDIVYTVLIDGSPTSLTVTLAANAASGTPCEVEIDPGAGSLIEVTAAKQGSLSNGGEVGAVVTLSASS